MHSGNLCPRIKPFGCTYGSRFRTLYVLSFTSYAEQSVTSKCNAVHTAQVASYSVYSFVSMAMYSDNFCWLRSAPEFMSGADVFVFYSTEEACLSPRSFKWWCRGNFLRQHMDKSSISSLHVTLKDQVMFRHWMLIVLLSAAGCTLCKYFMLYIYLLEGKNCDNQDHVIDIWPVRRQILLTVHS